MVVRLDPVPFSGKVALKFRNLPAFIKTVSIDLRDAASGEVRYAGSLGAQQTMTLSNLRAGIGYQVQASAYRANGRLYQTIASEIVRFDPLADEVEQERILEMAF